jgi:hypothetical protein
MSVHGETASRVVPPHVQLIQMGTPRGQCSRVCRGRSAWPISWPPDQEAPLNWRDRCDCTRPRCIGWHAHPGQPGHSHERDEQRFADAHGRGAQTAGPRLRATVIAFGGAFWHGWEEIVLARNGQHGLRQSARHAPL